jgi:8-oxo-dGTP pyrophosphatase MutT (NUDIX family)
MAAMVPESRARFEEQVRRVVAQARTALERPDLTRAAVLVPIVFRDDGPYLILTRRTMCVARHKGQISFPGGVAEPADDGPAGTALREATEEIALDPTHVEVVGLLDDSATKTGFVITPVVGFVAPEATFRADPVEVAELFEVPFAALRDPRNQEVAVIERGGDRYRDQRYHVDGKTIWGATGRIISRLITAVDAAG